APSQFPSPSPSRSAPAPTPGPSGSDEGSGSTTPGGTTSTPTLTPTPTPTVSTLPPPPPGTSAIDATALSSRTFSVSGVNGSLDSSHVHSLKLQPGQHTLSTPGSAAVPFTVDSTGNFDYDQQIDYLRGRGTNTLTVRGLAYTIDATALSTASV